MIPRPRASVLRIVPSLFAGAVLALGSAGVGATVAPALGGAAQAASFDCTRARAADERAICGNRALEDKDVELATIFGLITRVVPMGSRGALRDDQTAWLAQRGRCGGSVTCIRRAYDSRIAALRAVYEQRVVRNGPF